MFLRSSGFIEAAARREKADIHQSAEVLVTRVSEKDTASLQVPRVMPAKKSGAAADHYRSMRNMPKDSKLQDILGNNLAHSRASSKISRKQDQLSAARALKGNKALKNAVNEFRKDRADRYSKKKGIK